MTRLIRSSFALAAVSMLIAAGCANGSESSDEADTTEVQVVGGEGSDSIVPDSASPDTDASDAETPDSESAGESGSATVADVLGAAKDYVDGALAALEPEKSVDAGGYCRDLASTMRDTQTRVEVPAAGSASAEVIDGVNTWNQQTELLAGTLDKCVQSPDPAAFLASKQYAMALAVWDACLKKLFNLK